MDDTRPTATAPARPNVNGWGGRRPGAGRKPRAPNLTPSGEALWQDLDFRLTMPEWQRLRRIGEGSAAAGVRRLLDSAGAAHTD